MEMVLKAQQRWYANEDGHGRLGFMKRTMGRNKVWNSGRFCDNSWDIERAYAMTWHGIAKYLHPMHAKAWHHVLYVP
ncbi:unnamed protein product [Sphagnum jensenii]